MRLGVRVGEACRNLMDETMRELPCQKIEVDEIWGFVGKKDRNVTEEDRLDSVARTASNLAASPHQA